MPRQVSADRFVASMCRNSFYQFFLEFWPIIAAEKLNDAWYIKHLCNDLQVMSERVFVDKPKEYDFIHNCPPGTTKSSILSVAWQPWIWTRMPSARFISGSYAERLALDLSRKSRDIVLSDKYQRLFPDIKLREDQNTKGYFANTKGGMRYAVGVGGTVIGMHAHFIGIDDPVDPQAVLSDLILADANSWISETLSRRKVNAMLTPTALIMQRLHQNDPTGHMLESGIRIKNNVLPCDTSWDIQPTYLRDFYVDGLLDPVRYGREALQEAFIVLGEAGYAGQMGQSPIPRGGALFKVDRLSYSSVLPGKWKMGPVRYWDKAATAMGGAYTAGPKMALDFDDRVWILDMVRGQWDSGFRETKILETAYLDGKGVRVGIEQEPAGSGKESAEATLKRLALAGFRAYANRATGDKILRAEPLSILVNIGKVVLVNALWNKVFVDEMKFFPRSKYKDQIDAASGCLEGLAKKRLRIGAL